MESAGEAALSSASPHLRLSNQISLHDNEAVIPIKRKRDFMCVVSVNYRTDATVSKYCD